MNNIQEKILSELSENMSIEQLKMVELAMSKAFIGYKVEPMETLPACQNNTYPYLKEFLIRKSIEGCSKGTIYGYENFLKIFLFWTNGKDLDTFEDNDILVFLAWYENTHSVSKRTLNNKRVILSSFFTYLHNTGKINHNPMKTVNRIKFLAKVRQPLTDEELEIIRDSVVDIREKALIEFLYSTGCRVSEVVNVNITDLDLDKRTLVVTGKGNKQRRVFINAKTKLSIQSYLKTREDHNDALFVSTRKPYRRLSKGSIEKIVKDIGIRSGIGKNLFPHLLRHTFATDMYERTGNIADLQRLMGHENADTTMVYAKISQTKLKETYRMGMY